MPPYIAQLHAMVEEWSSSGVKIYGDGSRLVGHIPERGVGAYLHRLFAPMPMEFMERIEETLKVSTPEILREFYSFHNGCMLFSETLCVFGARRSYDRADIDALSCNPFDIIVPTALHFRKSPSGKGLTLHTYADGSVVLLEPGGEVLLVRESGERTLDARWRSFPDWIISEYQRIETLYKSKSASIFRSIEAAPYFSRS